LSFQVCEKVFKGLKGRSPDIHPINFVPWKKGYFLITFDSFEQVERIQKGKRHRGGISGGSVLLFETSPKKRIETSANVHPRSLFK
jgi:hypothetical protein